MRGKVIVNEKENAGKFAVNKKQGAGKFAVNEEQNARKRFFLSWIANRSITAFGRSSWIGSSNAQPDQKAKDLGNFAVLTPLSGGRYKGYCIWLNLQAFGEK